ncbi:HEAT repeat domain-containing protein [Botrimarina hoheduenensis]|uniref:HEAT repeat protein n=1 Tax=Botrimarina hoheduenensis TaxID=2528000 RepID=A0A5C5WDP2_9BACT|nr:HEAT repeat domain-containing protein [Botrimarina hoheduenensis]TWT48814.1 HEAT repeat protein [Botrimarina hoheduenensis]
MPTAFRSRTAARQAPVGIEATLRVLLHCQDESSDAVLAVAAASSDPALRIGAVRTILRRHSLAAHANLVRGWNRLAEDALAVLLAEAPRASFASSLQRFLGGSEGQLAEASAKLAAQALVVEALPALITRVLTGRSAKNEPLAVLALSRELRRRLDNPPTRKEGLADPAFARRAALNELALALTQFHQHGQADLIDALLEITPADDPLFLQTLTDPERGGHAALIERLRAATGTGVVALYAALLDNTATPTVALEAIASRADLATLDPLLARFSKRLGMRVSTNVKRLKDFEWLANERRPELLTLSDQAVAGAIRLMGASEVSRRRLVTLLEQVLLSVHDPRVAAGFILGDAARLAAAEVIGALPPHLANTPLALAARDPSPAVVTAAANLIGKKQLPNDNPILVEMLSHPAVEVRRAAQRSMKGITYSWLRDEAAEMDFEEQRRTGSLVAKADPLAQEQLRSELGAPGSKRRLKAIEMAEILGLVDEVVDDLMARLNDPDAAVRAEAARCLGTSAGEPRVQQALAELHRDPAVGVRRAAEQSYAMITGRHERALLPAGRPR